MCDAPTEPEGNLGCGHLLIEEDPTPLLSSEVGKLIPHLHIYTVDTVKQVAIASLDSMMRGVQLSVSSQGPLTGL
jgi:hypothetical protein